MTSPSVSVSQKDLELGEEEQPEYSLVDDIQWDAGDQEIETLVKEHRDKHTTWLGVLIIITFLAMACIFWVPISTILFTNMMDAEFSMSAGGKESSAAKNIAEGTTGAGTTSSGEAATTGVTATDATTTGGKDIITQENGAKQNYDSATS